MPFACPGNALERLFCLESFTIFERHKGLKWLCGVCGIQLRRWERLVWGRPECCKSMRPMVFAGREEKGRLDLQGNTAAVVKEQWIRAQGQHPIAAHWEQACAVIPMCKPVFECLLPSHLLSLIWKSMAKLTWKGSHPSFWVLYHLSVFWSYRGMYCRSQVVLLCILWTATPFD